MRSIRKMSAIRSSSALESPLCLLTFWSCFREPNLLNSRKPWKPWLATTTSRWTIWKRRDSTTWPRTRLLRWLPFPSTPLRKPKSALWTGLRLMASTPKIYLTKRIRRSRSLAMNGLMLLISTSLTNLRLTSPKENQNVSMVFWFLTPWWAWTWPTKTATKSTDALPTRNRLTMLSRLAADWATMRGNLYTTSNSGRKMSKQRCNSPNNWKTVLLSYARLPTVPIRSSLWPSCTSRSSVPTLTESLDSASHPSSSWEWSCLTREWRQKPSLRWWRSLLNPAWKRCTVHAIRLNRTTRKTSGLSLPSPWPHLCTSTSE